MRRGRRAGAIPPCGGGKLRLGAVGQQGGKGRGGAEAAAQRPPLGGGMGGGRGPAPSHRAGGAVSFQPVMGTLLLSLVPWALFVLWTPALLRQRPRIAAYAPPAEDAAPLVSIIVPA